MDASSNLHRLAVATTSTTSNHDLQLEMIALLDKSSHCTQDAWLPKGFSPLSIQDDNISALGWDAWG